MDEAAWMEDLCRGLCKNKGIDPEQWRGELPTVIEIMKALKAAGAVVVPIVGEAE